MLSNTISDITTYKEQGSFIEKLGKHINQDVYLKIEQDDTPITYTLKGIGKDHIVVLFAHMERTIPIQRILFFQVETKDPIPNPLI